MKPTAVRKRKAWIIAGPPHFLIRVKRVFVSADADKLGTVRFTDTLDTCRDLEWLTQRYDVELSALDAAYLERRAKEHRRREASTLKILGGKLPTRDYKLALPPRDYQKRAIELVLLNRGLLVADDLGLGKTLVAIGALTPAKSRPALVVCPANLQQQWAREFARFAPQLKVHTIRSMIPYDYTEGGEVPDVFITSYHKLPSWVDVIGPVLKSVVYEEVHELRRGPKDAYSGSLKGTAAERLSKTTTMRLGLSATPIYNYGGEIFNIMQALRPGALGTKNEFFREWGATFTGREGMRLHAPDALGEYMKTAGFMVRRTRGEVGRELPDLIKIPHHVDADIDALEKIGSNAAELARVILFQNAERGAAFRAGGELDAMVRQATGIAKAPYVATFVKMMLEAGEKVLLGGWHHEVYRIWLEQLAAYRPALYTGKESLKRKEESRKRFIDGETPLLIMSLRSGVGLDGLQHAGCRNVVYGELDWSPSVLEQLAGRLHRDGQTQAVAAYYLISDSGSDPVMADVLGVKRAQLDGIRDPGGRKDGLAKLDAGGAHIKLLAAEVLKRAGRGWAVEGRVAEPELTNDTGSLG